jgi:hypothetical protein
MGGGRNTAKIEWKHFTTITYKNITNNDVAHLLFKRDALKHSSEEFLLDIGGTIDNHIFRATLFYHASSIQVIIPSTRLCEFGRVESYLYWLLDSKNIRNINRYAILKGNITPTFNLNDLKSARPEMFTNHITFMEQLVIRKPIFTEAFINYYLYMVPNGYFYSHYINFTTIGDAVTLMDTVKTIIETCLNLLDTTKTMDVCNKITMSSDKSECTTFVSDMSNICI